MTSTGRLIVACVVLAGATAAAIVGALIDHPNAGTYLGAAGATYALVLGYAFGHINGEKMVAQAVLEAQAAATRAMTPNTGNVLAAGVAVASKVAAGVPNVLTPTDPAPDPPPVAPAAPTGSSSSGEGG